jgi:hypothetical protein
MRAGVPQKQAAPTAACQKEGTFMLFPSVEAAAASFANRPSSPRDSLPDPASEPPPR